MWALEALEKLHAEWIVVEREEREWKALCLMAGMPGGGWSLARLELERKRNREKQERWDREDAEVSS